MDDPQEKTPETEPEGKDEKQEEKLFKQADMDSLAGKVRKETRESVRKELFEKAGVTSEKELLEIIAERKAKQEAEMTEAEKARSLAAEEKASREKLQKELDAIHFEREFSKVSRSLQYEYANEQAERDALTYLSGSTDIEADMKKLAQDRPYLFKVRQEKPEIDSKEKGIQVKGELTEARKKELEQRFPALRKT